MKRSIIIMNLVMAGGGDYALGNKIKDIARNTQAEGMILTIDAESRTCRIKKQEYFNPGGTLNYTRPIIIVAPYSIMKARLLASTLQMFFYENRIDTATIILIDEMDVVRDAKTEDHCFKTALYSLGFKDVIFHSLGFNKKSLGYLPMPEQEVISIEKSAKQDIIKLLDSLNLSLPDSCSLYLAYLSSGTVRSCARVFIINTLIEDRCSRNNSAYVLVCREEDGIKPLLNNLTKFFQKPPYNNLFSECHYSIMKDEDKIMSYGHVRGAGNKKIHICITKTVPSTTFKKLTSISKTGMMSGDQSLSDYLSLKERLPYYDKQSWKEPLIDGLNARAHEMGGEELLNKFQSMVAGRTAYTGAVAFKLLAPDDAPTPMLKNNLLAFNREVFARKADRTIREMLIKLL